MLPYELQEDLWRALSGEEQNLALPRQGMLDKTSRLSLLQLAINRIPDVGICEFKQLGFSKKNGEMKWRDVRRNEEIGSKEGRAEEKRSEGVWIREKVSEVRWVGG